MQPVHVVRVMQNYGFFTGAAEVAERTDIIHSVTHKSAEEVFECHHVWRNSKLCDYVFMSQLAADVF
jgi:hypothetical protein